MTFIDSMEALASVLRRPEVAVDTPVREEADITWDNLTLDEATVAKSRYVEGYLEVIRSSDLVLIANYDKGGVTGYVGANALIEAAFAHALGKPVAFLNLPGPQSCRLEALALMSTCLDGDISRLL
jgi:hypothetical protein